MPAGRPTDLTPQLIEDEPMVEDLDIGEVETLLEPMTQEEVDADLAVIQRAAAEGDEDAAAWLRGEGSIRVVQDRKDGSFRSEFVCWDEADGRTSQRALDWSKAVYARDDYTCQRCGQRGGKLQAHHIKGWAEYPDLRFDLANGETICVECHAREHPGRENLIRKSRYLKRRHGSP